MWFFDIHNSNKFSIKQSNSFRSCQGPLSGYTYVLLQKYKVSNIYNCLNSSHLPVCSIECRKHSRAAFSGRVVCKGRGRSVPQVNVHKK